MAFSVDQLVADCLAAVRGSDGHAAPAVKEILSRTISDPSAIEAALGAPRDMPVLSAWFNSDELTILHVVWPPSAELSPHDHLMWASIGLYGGREDNEMYRRLPDDTIEHRRSTILRAGDTVMLGADAVHSVANPSREWTGAIHVYGGDFFRDGRSIWADETQVAEPYNAERIRDVLSEASVRAKSREADDLIESC